MYKINMNNLTGTLLSHEVKSLEKLLIIKLLIDVTDGLDANTQCRKVEVSFISFHDAQNPARGVDETTYGKLVEVTYGLRSREYNGKYYYELSGKDLIYLSPTKEKGVGKVKEGEVVPSSEPIQDDLPFN